MLEIREGVQERGDRRPLPVPPAKLAVVAEVVGQQALDGPEVAAVDRLLVEVADELLVRVERSDAAEANGDTLRE
ncbi:MAG: hypothetical protein R2718_01550 [Solirubrobacterales bacterium]